MQKELNSIRAPKKKKYTIEEIVSDTAKATAQEVVNAQRRQRNLNMYRTMERLLRGYKKHRWALEHLDEFDFFPQGKSKSISIAPPPGSGMVDKIDLTEAFVRAKVRAFEAKIVSWYMADIAIQQYKDRPEFVVIRMYYFNEDANGQDRGDEAKRYTWEEIARELADIGLERSVTTLRSWRSTLVQEMTVLLFGVDGALSIEAREPKGEERSNAQKTSDHN